MGFSHYWNFKKPKGKRAAEIEDKYKRALVECAHIAHAWQRDAQDWERLSGYTAHCKPGTYGGLLINGKGDEAHEDFALREHFRENEGFGFCKTARKPYDTVVTACLALLKYRLGDAIEVSSDGDASDWDADVKPYVCATRAAP